MLGLIVRYMKTRYIILAAIALGVIAASWLAIRARPLRSNPDIQDQLVLVANSLVKPGKSYQDWLQIEKQFAKLMEAAGQDRKNILREMLYISTYERERRWQGGRGPDMAHLLAYCNFTKEEVVAVVKPLLDTKDDRLRKGALQILRDTEFGTWGNYHRSILGDIEQAKKADDNTSQK
jgi:hypothetical protein